jgi:hypothetical protein
MADPIEHERRRLGVGGIPVLLADGRLWLLAIPTFRPRLAGLTMPLVDEPLDRIFESAVLGEALDLTDLWQVARELLTANYELTQEELAGLLSTTPGSEIRALATAIIQAIFGPDPGKKSYTHWVRASLLANGLGDTDIPAHDLANVLAVLVATKRTIPLSQFADACRHADERARLESLI